MAEKQKGWIKRHPVWTGIIGFFVLMLVIGVFTDNSSNQKVYDSSHSSSAPQTQDSLQNTQTTTPTQTSEAAVEEQSDKTTMGERNALSKAQSYLDVMAFSYSGLIKQLEYEGYSHEEAKYGADNCEANWNEQAALKAQSYLDVMPFSREGLINQLKYDGFTSEQAEYGVQAVGY